MPLRTRESCVLGFCISALLAGCAAPPQTHQAQKPSVQNPQAPPTDPGLSGTILAVHPVPVGSVQQVETLLSGADPRSEAMRWPETCPNSSSGPGMEQQSPSCSPKPPICIRASKSGS